MNSRNRLFLFLICLSVPLFGCKEAIPDISLSENYKVVSELGKLGRFPLQISPNGRDVLYSNSSATRQFGLMVVNADSGRASSEFLSELPIVRAVWRPGHRQISYFLQKDNTERSLFLWSLEGNYHEIIDVPVTHNQNELAWSSDGELLAYTSDKKALVVVRIRDGAVLAIPGEFKTFAWSPDSNSVAALPLGNHERSIEIYSVDDASLKKRIGPIKDRNLVNIDWVKGGAPVVRGESANKDISTFYMIDYEATEMRVISELPGRITRFKVCPDGKSLLLLKREGRYLMSLEHSDLIGSTKSALHFEGNIDVKNVIWDKNRIDFSLISPLEYSINSCAIDDLSKGATAIGKAEAHVSQDKVESQFVTIKSSVRGEVQFHLALLKSSRKRVIVRVGGGGYTNFSASWPERQLYLRRGISYISLANRDGMADADLLDICEYIKRELGVSFDDIAVIGESTAAVLALQAAIKQPDQFRVLAIIGLVAQPAFKSPEGLGKMQLLAFHGELDPFSSLKARSFIINAVGGESIVSPNGLWHVFPGEAHSLRSSIGIVHGTILTALGD